MIISWQAGALAAAPRRTRVFTHVLATASLAGLLVVPWFAGLAIVEGSRLARILSGSFRGSGFHAKLGQVVPGRFAVVTEGGQRDTIDLSRASAIVLVYDVRCSVCNENMPRWVDLVAEARQRARGVVIYAIPATADSAAVRAGYWDGLERTIRVVHPVDSTLARAIAGSPMTPMTVVIRDGVRVAAHAGYLGDRRREYLIRKAQ